MSVGSRIYNNRKRLFLSQDALAEKLGVSRQTISKWETDEVLPDANNLKLLSNCFSISTDELLFGESRFVNDNEFETKLNNIGEKGTNLFKRHWQKLGYYLMYTSVPFLIFGFIGRMMANNFRDFDDSMGFIDTSFGFPDPSRIILQIPTFILLLGLLILVIGIVLVVYDRIKAKKTSNGV